jgi:hypothetical protein
VTDGPPRHLTPVHTGDEPPYDPDYDNPTPRKPGDRTPPQDTTAEQAVLGAMLTTAQAITDVEPELDPSDFWRPSHEQIYNAILQLHSTGTPVDMVTLAGHLAATPAPGKKSANLLTTVGGAPYLHTLSIACPVPSSAVHYAKIVRDNARLRTVVDTGTRITQLGYSGDADRVDIVLGEALQRLDETVQRFGGHGTGPGIGTGLVDLSWVLTGGEAPRQPQPIYVRRTDGSALFYKGQVNGVIGDPEHGKTWLAQLAIVEALDAGETASMIDTDHNGPNASAARLLLLGARPEQLADPARFHYYEPQDGEQLLNAVAETAARRDDVVLVDSLGEVFGLLGVNENHGDEVTSAMRRVCTVPAVAGACVITIDHLPKSNEARATGFAIGSIAKKRMIRGAYLRADAKQKPAPGQVGRITLRIEKDTMGELRRSSGGGYAGTLVLDSTHDYALEWSIKREVIPVNDDGTKRWTTVMERVARYIEEHSACSGRDIETDVPGGAKRIREALAVLVNEGFIRREPGPRRSFFHYSEIPYREAEDDHAQPE